MNRKVIAFLLSLAMLLALCACGNEPPITDETPVAAPTDQPDATQAPAQAEETAIEPVEGKYPIHIQLDDLFADDDAWETAYTRAIEIAETGGQFKGKLNTAQGLYDYFKFAYDDELTELENLLSFYATLGYYRDLSNSDCRSMLSRMNKLYMTENIEQGYVDGEIYSIPMAEREELFADPVMEPYAYVMRSYCDPAVASHSEETTVALEEAQMSFGMANSVYSVLKDNDLIYPEITMPDGSVQTLDSALLDEIISGDYPHEFVRDAENLYFSVFGQYSNTFAALLNTQLTENYADALLSGFDTTRAYKLHTEDIEEEIYGKNIDAVHALFNDFHRYCTLHAKALGVDDQCFSEVERSVTDYDTRISYDDAADIILEALAPMGEEYVANVKTMLESGHIDVYPADGKTTSQFTLQAFNSKILPYIFLNYNGYTADASSLAHELGHAMYSVFSCANDELNTVSSAGTVFIHEIASTCNEFILNRYMLDKAQSREEKILYLQNLINIINDKVIRQTMYSELEDYMYGLVEAGDSLDAEDVSDKWAELTETYFGEGVSLTDNYRYRWEIVPHFYMGYYVYKYATAATYASIFANRILSGDSEGLASYLELLTLGSSEKPSDLLRTAGIDPMGDSAYEELADFYRGMIDEYEALLNS